MTTVKLVKRITSETVGPDPERFAARCEGCTWESIIRVKYPDSLEQISRSHVRQTGHSVVIEEAADE